jgi:hypothetical protein
MGPRTGLDAMEKRKTLPLPGIEPRQSSQYPVIIPTELSWLLAILRSAYYIIQEQVQMPGSLSNPMGIRLCASNHYDVHRPLTSVLCCPRPGLAG